jgi:nicotinamide-nucleotide amidase
MVDRDQLDEIISQRNLCVAVAESLTGGALTAALVAVPGSGDWLRGGIVAYHSSVKFAVLGVTPGCVVSESCALEMARGVAAALEADVGLASTGVAGPEPFEDQPVGTVIVAAVTGEASLVRRYRFDGSPELVRAQTVEAGLELLADLLGCPPA